MRITASWFGSHGTYRIQVCGAMIRAEWQAPLGPYCFQLPLDCNLVRDERSRRPKRDPTIGAKNREKIVLTEIVPYK